MFTAVVSIFVKYISQNFCFQANDKCLIASSSQEKVLYIDSLVEKKAIGLHWEFSCSMTVPTAVLDASVVSRIFVTRLLSMYDSFV